jgi:RHS repeat-associated protein
MVDGLRLHPPEWPDHADYSAFGRVLDESSPTSGDRFVSFAGLERDTVTELNLAVEREENPGTGRWDGEDPLGFGAGDADLYRYAANDPTDIDDPTGLGWGAFAPVPPQFDFRPRPNRTRPTWWDLYFQYWNPFYTPTPSVDWLDTGLKVGKGTAAVTGAVCAAGAGGLAVAGTAAAAMGVGTTAVVGPGLGPGTYPALLINGVVYVHRFHVLALELAGGTAASGAVQKYGMVIIDASGKVIGWIGKK